MAQSRKQIKETKVPSVIVTSTENDNPINEKKLFDAIGNEIENVNFNKGGDIKSVHKTKYNSDNYEIEDLEYDSNNKFIEKKITKYYMLGEKTEVDYYDAANNQIKICLPMISTFLKQKKQYILGVRLLV